MSEFEKHYSGGKRPLVVRNASSLWKAIETLDYQWLKTEYQRKVNLVRLTNHLQGLQGHGPLPVQWIGLLWVDYFLNSFMKVLKKNGVHRTTVRPYILKAKKFAELPFQSKKNCRKVRKSGRKRFATNASKSSLQNFTPKMRKSPR